MQGYGLCYNITFIYILSSRPWVTDVRLWRVGGAVGAYTWDFGPEAFPIQPLPPPPPSFIPDHIVCLSGDEAFGED